jgi:SAM-dependent methyltransferase
VYVGNEIVHYVNFQEAARMKLNSGFHKIAMAGPSSFYGKLHGATNISEMVYTIGSDGDCTPVFTAKDIWTLVQKESIYKENRKTEKEIQKATGENVNYMDISCGTAFKFLKWIDGNVIGFTVNVSLFRSRGALIILFKDSNGSPQVVFHLALINKLCVDFDTIVDGDNIDLCVGLLATGDNPEYLVQIFKGVNKPGGPLQADDKDWCVKSNGETSEDILGIKTVSNNRLFAIQNDQVLYDINLRDMDYKTLTIDNLEKIDYYP